MIIASGAASRMARAAGGRADQWGESVLRREGSPVMGLNPSRVIFKSAAPSPPATRPKRYHRAYGRLPGKISENSQIHPRKLTVNQVGTRWQREIVRACCDRPRARLRGHLVCPRVFGNDGREILRRVRAGRMREGVSVVQLFGRGLPAR